MRFYWLMALAVGSTCVHAQDSTTNCEPSYGGGFDCRTKAVDHGPYYDPPHAQGDMQPTQLQALRTQVQALQTEQERIQGRKSLTIPPEKLEIIKRDAEKGRPDAQYLLGAFYWYGANVPGNAELAVKWFMKAAAQGQSGAQSDLALAYVTGEGIAQDKVLAYAWFNLTAAQGDQNSARNL